MTDTTQPDTPAAQADSAQDGPAADDATPDTGQDVTDPQSDADSDGETVEDVAVVWVLLDKALAGRGEAGEPVACSAEDAAALHDAGHGTIIANADAHLRGLEGDPGHIGGDTPQVPDGEDEDPGDPDDVGEPPEYPEHEDDAE